MVGHRSSTLLYLIGLIDSLNFVDYCFTGLIVFLKSQDVSSYQIDQQKNDKITGEDRFILVQQKGHLQFFLNVFLDGAIDSPIVQRFAHFGCSMLDFGLTDVSNRVSKRVNVKNWSSWCSHFLFS